MNVAQLEKIATVIKRLAIHMVHQTGSGHPGYSLSCIATPPIYTEECDFTFRKAIEWRTGKTRQ